MSEVLAKRIFIFSAVFLIAVFAFIYGMATIKLQLWPYQKISMVWDAAKSLNEWGELVPKDRRRRAPKNASRNTFTVHDSEQINNGYYVFAGWDNKNSLYAAWLYDNQGQLFHKWLIDYNSLDSDGPSNKSDDPHAFHMLPDGSLILGWDKGDIMARLDSCAKPIWIKEGIYHHSMSKADDGSFWVWRGEGTAYGHYHYMENFDSESGDKIQEIALIEDVIMNMEETSVIFGIRPDYNFKHFEQDPEDQDEIDLFHPNDVDILSSELASNFPMFNTGDLLLSLRTNNLIAVLDSKSYQVKWWSHGPWVGQHDPDFTSDGKISVYNNNTSRGRRSEIIKIDPKTGQISNELFHGELEFYSKWQGKHQYLPNGNVLIVIPGEGRILEVTSDGKEVMEFNNLSPVSLEHNEHVFNAMWVESDYFQSFPECQQ